MAVILNQIFDPLCDLRVVTADLLNIIPRKEIRHQKFSRLFMRPALPTPRADRRPVQIFQRAKIGIKGSVKCARVTVTDRPVLSKPDSDADVANQMNDSFLTTTRPARIALIDRKQHRRTRTEIK